MRNKTVVLRVLFSLKNEKGEVIEAKKIVGEW